MRKILKLPQRMCFQGLRCILRTAIRSVIEMRCEKKAVFDQPKGKYWDEGLRRED